MEMELGKEGTGREGEAGKTAQVATTFNVLNLIIPQQLSIMQRASGQGNGKTPAKGTSPALSQSNEPGDFPSLFPTAKRGEKIVTKNRRPSNCVNQKNNCA